MITLKDLKFNCIGFRGIDDEWYSNSDYEAYLKIDNHHYHINLWKRNSHKWCLCIYLCLTAINSNDIRIFETSAKTMKELKETAVKAINSYHNTDRCNKDIEKWKETHGKKVFDENYNYLGISYTNPERDMRDTEFDYYNDKKPNITYGTYYMLDGDSVIYYDKNPELVKKLTDPEIYKIKKILFNYSQIDGAHHKAWCLDQIARIIYGEHYDEFIKDYCEDDKYEWDCGIAP